MTKPLDLIRAACVARYQGEYQEEVFQKALGRLKTWSKNAYGTASLKEYLENSEADSINAYYDEVLKDTTKGIDTHNRQAYWARTRDQGKRR